MEQEVLEYFEAYFGETLNESTSDEDIMEAVYDLVALRDAVCDVIGLDESFGNLRKSPYAPAGWTSKGGGWVGSSINQDIEGTQAHIGRVKKNLKDAQSSMQSRNLHPDAPHRKTIQNKADAKTAELNAHIASLRNKVR